MTTPAPAGGSKSRRAAPYLVKVEPVPPAPLLRVFVAGNPVGSNHMYGNRKTFDKAMHSRHLTENARAWRESIAITVMPWRFPESAPRPTLAVSCTFIGARADVDNLLKLALDGIKDGLMVDDRYVLRVAAEKQPLPPGGERGAWIEVRELPQQQKPQRQRRQRRMV